jgi:putative spermidine/putrescine transport system substrate-binding protein
MRLTRRTLIKAGASAVAFPTIISRVSAQDVKQLHVGVYNSAQGRLIQKEIIPKFEAEFKCRVFTIEGATLSNIAALRATRDAPPYARHAMRRDLVSCRWTMSAYRRPSRRG